MRLSCKSCSSSTLAVSIGSGLLFWLIVLMVAPPRLVHLRTGNYTHQYSEATSRMALSGNSLLRYLAAS